MDIFAEKLKSLRIERNFSQDFVAKQTGLGRSSIAMYESGKREPNARAIIALAKFFGVTADYLLGLSD